MAALCNPARELALLHNPVTKRENYRLFVIHKIPSLRVLDFTRIRDKVRLTAAGIVARRSCASRVPLASGRAVEGLVMDWRCRRLTAYWSCRCCWSCLLLLPRLLWRHRLVRV